MILIGRLSKMSPPLVSQIPHAIYHGRNNTCIFFQGQLWAASSPQGCNFYPIVRYDLTEPVSLFKCGKFNYWNPRSELWLVKVCYNVKEPLS